MAACGARDQKREKPAAWQGAGAALDAQELALALRCAGIDLSIDDGDRQRHERGAEHVVGAGARTVAFRWLIRL